MPNSKTVPRRGSEKDVSRRGRLPEKASSFHGWGPVTMDDGKELRRPRTLPDLRSMAVSVQAGTLLPAAAGEEKEKPRLTKLLPNVTIQGSLGPVQVIMSPDSSVQDLIAIAIKQYVKEGRRPILRTGDSSGFDLHYSQFSLESLGKDEKLMSLGSRNFFLCRRKETEEAMAAAQAATCSKEAHKATKTGFNWLKFMDF